MYNQYAWLIGNTEGDFDEALKCSRKSLELQPDEGGYYDTLAHVYFGKGDLRKRRQVPNQGRRARSPFRPDPAKLEVFRKKLEEKKKK